ncbi:hypothetical protein CPB84DRAFT_1767422 [Gymnopilus junonius]|uniref:Uncharacterized protein n=1 Tax=Gymnopilus junonius TaxID=109634 RepID=A0A9P5TQW6_GYMJU|nr:hypothetical protein CPB84DRAFT_1767422 [Gymnopilus junonius]
MIVPLASTPTLFLFPFLLLPKSSQSYSHSHPTPKSPQTPSTSTSTLNLDVIYTIIHELIQSLPDRRDRQPALRNLSLVSHALNDAVRPVLFDTVRWPQGDKHGMPEGKEGGVAKGERGKEELYFFPKKLWVYFRTVHLDWPDHWPDTSPPTWGTIQCEYGLYTPSHLHKLESALPHLTNMHTFQMTCPFYPPNSLLRVLVSSCPSLKDLRIVDTPFNSGITARSLQIPKEKEKEKGFGGLERITLVPVGEAIRVGEGPFEKRYHDLAYWTREYRKKHWSEMNYSSGSGGFFARSLMHLFCSARPENLVYIQISGIYFTIFDFTQCAWPKLDTWILTGPEPIWGGAILVEALKRMPVLRDLRVLSSKATGIFGTNDGHGREKFPIAARYGSDRDKDNEVFRRLKCLALSNKLAFVALINHPRIPIAMRRREVDELVKELEGHGAGRGLRHVRMVMEDGVDVGLFVELGRVCPGLEVLEVEVCGYREGDAVFEWVSCVQVHSFFPISRMILWTRQTDYGDAFATYHHLRKIRVGIPFEGSDAEQQLDHVHEGPSVDPDAFLRADRRDCGVYIASRVPTLEQIGFEYRTKTGSHRYEDRWLDFKVERAEGEKVQLKELGLTWYPFPEVWEPRVLLE